MAWDLYDKLIEPIPDTVLVDSVLVGSGSTLVKVGEAAGAAATNHLQSRPRIVDEELWENGMTWKAAASLIKSWNFTEAAIGAAAVNAFYNRRQQLEMEISRTAGAVMMTEKDTFAAHAEDLRGKKVATIGHFYYAEQFLKQAGEVFILEREVKNGDYPDTACEYLLPEMDYVFITGFTLVNKTLPRLLELSGNGRVILVGPSVPMAPVLFSFGVDELAGTLITDVKKTENLIRQGSNRAVTRSGCQVRAGIEKMGFSGE